MQRRDFVSKLDPADPLDLEIENDLLVHEVAFLRAKVDRLEKSAKGAGGKLERAKANKRRAQAELRATKKELEQTSAERDAAKKDIRWILERIDSSPAGRLVRSRDGFQVLAKRWMSGS